MKVSSHCAVCADETHGLQTRLSHNNITNVSATMIRKILVAISALFLLFIGLTILQNYNFGHSAYNGSPSNITTTHRKPTYHYYNIHFYNRRANNFYTIPEMDEMAGNETNAEEYLIYDAILNPDDFVFGKEDADLRKALERFHVHTYALSWQDAAMACWREGGRLAAPGDVTEAKLLGRLLQYTATNANITNTNNSHIMHIGITGLAAKEYWTNAEGGNLKYVDFLNGAIRQYPLSTCGGIFTNGRFVAVSCDEEAIYVCDTEPVQEDQSQDQSQEDESKEDDGYEASGDTNNLHFLYRLYLNPLPWIDAHKECGKEGGALVTPVTQKQSDAISSWLFSRSDFPTEARNAGVLIAFTDVMAEKIWMTYNDIIPMTHMPYGIKWLHGKPSGDRAWNCLALFPPNIYGDVPCSDPRPFVCEKRNLRVNLAEQGERGVYTAIQGLGRYALHNESKTWWQAVLTCRSENASLVVIDSKEEADALAEMVNYSIYVGVHDSDNDKIWRTLDGKRVYHSSFNVWDSNTYNRKFVIPMCAKFGGGRYMTQICGRKSKFICEKPL